MSGHKEHHIPKLNNSSMRAEVKRLLRQGFALTNAGNGYVTLTAPDGETCRLTSAKNNESMPRLRAWARKHGGSA